MIQTHKCSLENYLDGPKRLKTYSLSSNMINVANATELCKTLDVDALLISRLVRYVDNYNGFVRSSSILAHFSLVDGKTGETLWRGHLDEKERYYGFATAAIPPNLVAYVGDVVRTIPRAARK